MSSSLFRRIRIVFSTLVFIFFILVLLTSNHLFPANYIKHIIFYSLFPLWLTFYDLQNFSAGGFVVVLLLTLLTGRTYCSFFCPLGIGQDLFSRIGGSFKRKFRRYGFKKPFTILRYNYWQ
jgi:polyferredoxin